MVKFASYSEYLQSRANNANLFEMPLPPTAFKGEKGEFGDDVHVSTNSPVFMDKADIYYLYQFPRKYWTDAMYARYNRYLPLAKENPNFKDVQDIVLTGHHGVKLIFHDRNTFASHLVDKLERTVDVDHFRQSDKSPEAYKQHQQQLAQHRANKVDMGGYIGASLGNPKRFKPNDEDEVLVFQGMVAPNKQVVSSIVNKWIQGSSEGWLSDLSQHDHARTKVKAAGGRGGDSELAVHGPKALGEIEAKMRAFGAVPPVVGKNGNCLWPNVTVEGKKGSKKMAFFGGDLDNPQQGSPLPVLFPGREIHSKDIKAHQSDKEFLNKLKKMKGSDLEHIRGDLPAEIKNIEDEINRRDLQRKWETEDPDESSEREEMVDKLDDLKRLNDYRSWFKSKYPNTEITPEAIDKSLTHYQDVISQRMAERQKSARRYDVYDWNVHRFNRDRFDHDPLNVGMGNPTKLGGRKYENIVRSKTTGYGTFWPNRQSPSLLHGPKGEWEDKLQHHFGHGHDDKTDSVQLKSVLDAGDVGEIERSTKTYINKMAEKLIHNDEVLNALELNDSNSRTEAKMAFTNSASFLKLLREKWPSIKLDKNGGISGAAANDSIPQILKIAYTELKTTENNLLDVKEEATSGITSKSPIVSGVDRFLKGRYLATMPDLHFAMNASKLQLIRSAEENVRRTIGDSAFRTFMANQANNVRGAAKYQKLLDLKSFIDNTAYNYAVRISQLDFGQGTRREREKMIRSGRGKTQSVDVAQGEDGKTQAGNVAGDNRRDMAGTQDPRVVNGVEGWNKYRRTRVASDRDTHTIGHNVQTLYNAAVQQLAQKAGGVTATEKPFIMSIVTNADLFRLEKAKLEKAALESGQEMDEKELNKQAYANSIETLRQQKMLPADFNPSATVSDDEDMSGFAKNLKQRIADEGELDSDEREAAQIMAGWEEKGLNSNQVQLHLNDIATLAKSSRNEKTRRVADLLLLMHGRKPELGSFSVGKVAASATGQVLPDVDFNAQQQSEIMASLKKITGEVEELRKKRAAQQAVAPAQPAHQSPPSPPVQSKPGGSPLGRFVRKPTE